MHGEKPTKLPTKSIKGSSLTEKILTLCASGHFGVREAIATALESSTAANPTPSNPKISKERVLRLRQKQAD
jgi:hypothetical protein